MLIDTHAHLYLEKFNDDREAVIERAMSVGVQKVLLPNIDKSTIDDVFALNNSFPQLCLPMVGLHPCSVKKGYEEELDHLHSYIQRESVVAIGEIGIDLYWDTTFEKEQIRAFNMQIDWALDNNLPIAIHARKAMDKCIDIVRQRQNGNLRGVFHCFDQDKSSAEQIIDLNFYLGIGGIVTFKNSKLPSAIKEVPLDRIVIETDSPYLSPSPYRGKRNESAYVSLVADVLSNIYEVEKSRIEEVTSKNANDLFGLNLMA